MTSGLPGSKSREVFWNIDEPKLLASYATGPNKAETLGEFRYGASEEPKLLAGFDTGIASSVFVAKRLRVSRVVLIDLLP